MFTLFDSDFNACGVFLCFAQSRYIVIYVISSFANTRLKKRAQVYPVSICVEFKCSILARYIVIYVMSSFAIIVCKQRAKIVLLFQ